MDLLKYLVCVLLRFLFQFKISDNVSGFIIRVPLSSLCFGSQFFFIILRSLAQSTSLTTCIVNVSVSVSMHTSVTLTFSAVAICYIR